ncbi:LuxR C-terminal-related transcriptional regulator [Nocardia sp. NEAU-G5]|uniref:LuxR C-terminal-related transcriptional regulator n=1 Tax=Nocardia albiluteola TaxID=2842303 RepID=A0ABS6BB05_9NOCA|nr:LuxR C-terminal-related transcriptional regulator [Nocardia albiluteola]MBU3066626.1 LuxR C-terminal-related transcriptional regulator [Nocardia albiluteola]
MELLRPRDSDALRAELRQVAAASGLPVVFGGEVRAGTLLLSEFLGTRTSAMRGLLVRPDSGVGGAAVVSGRLTSVSDYRVASTITHHYDAPVLTEGLRAVVGMPVVVGGESRAVLYIATRDPGPIGDRAADLARQAGRRLAVELAIRDEVDRRLRLREAAAPVPEGTPADAVVAEQLRGIHAEIRGIAQTLDDAHARSRLRELSDRVARLMSGPHLLDDAPSLAPRELDVLAQIALGCTNGETAERLSLRPETVKSYLRSAMTKLGARTRHEAVVRARRLGFLP